MTISKIQLILAELLKKHGDIDVYFDCPKCNNAFLPNKIVTVAVHLTNNE